MHPAFRYSIILLITSLLILAGWFWLDKSGSVEPAVSAPSAVSAPLGVRAVVAVQRPFSNMIYTTGTVIASDQVWVQSEISGRITNIYFQEGQPVKKGQLLVKMNDADLRAQLRRAELNKELAEIREQRQKSLLENRAIAQEDYDVILNQLNTVKAEIELIRANLDKTEIRAPFDGMIGLRRVSVGSLIAPGTTIASLQNLDIVKIDFSIPERYAGYVKQNDRIRFNRQGSNEKLHAQVVAIEPRIDANTRTLSLRALAENRDADLLPGAFTEIEYQLSTTDETILIPAEALIPDLAGNSLFVFKEGVATRLRVESGIRTETHIQIVNGVSPGDTVITTGILQLREGLPVRITSIN